LPGASRERRIASGGRGPQARPPGASHTTPSPVSRSLAGGAVGAGLPGPSGAPESECGRRSAAQSRCSRHTAPPGNWRGFVHLVWLVFLLFEQGGDGLFRTRHGRKTLVEAYLVPASAHMRSPRSTSLGSSGLLKNSISGSSTIRPSETLRDKKEHGVEAAGRQLSSSLTCRAFVRALPRTQLLTIQEVPCRGKLSSLRLESANSLEVIEGREGG
jgi:hypothetical protein